MVTTRTSHFALAFGLVPWLAACVSRDPVFELLDAEVDVATNAAEAGDAGVEEAAGPSPFVVWLFFGDGETAPGVPVSSTLCPGMNMVTANYQVSWDTRQNAIKRIQARLDVIYRDFNIVFTYQKPTVPVFHTVVITNDGGNWCSPGGFGTIGALGPISQHCEMFTEPDTAFVFLSTGPLGTAWEISHVHGHLSGLADVTQAKDIMNPSLTTTNADALFTDLDQPIADINAFWCPPTQNSYRLMKDRYGAWPGGTKPSPSE